MLGASLALGCSAGRGAEPPDAVAILPDGLKVTERSGGCGALRLRALTLASLSGELRIYAALMNRGQAPVCSASFSVELFDSVGNSASAGVAGLLMRRFYRMVGEEAVAACVAPGESSWLAMQGLTSERALEGIARVEYWCNFWALDVAPLGALTVSALRLESGGSYSGVLTNGLEQPLSEPGVAVFPLDSVGRPLGVTFANGSSAVPPGADWSFVTAPVSIPSDDVVAFPTRGP